MANSYKNSNRKSYPRKMLRLIAAAFMLSLAACMSAPKFTISAHDPLLDKDGGVLLVTDVCLKYDPVGDDYVLLDKSKDSTLALMKVVENYLAYNQIQVRTTMIPFICGATVDVDNPLSRVSNDIEGEVTSAAQPYSVDAKIGNDPVYISALAKLATRAYHHPWVNGPNNDTASETKSGQMETSNSEVIDSEIDSNLIQRIRNVINSNEYTDALGIVGERTQAPSLLYVGAAAVSVSSGKHTASAIGSFLASMATAVAIGPVNFAGGQYAVVATPQATSDRRVISASLIDLNSKKIIWSNGITAGGDILDDAPINNIVHVDLLLGSMVRAEASKYSPPGAPPLKQSRLEN